MAKKKGKPAKPAAKKTLRIKKRLGQGPEGRGRQREGERSDDC